jgi:MFS transporter, DHA2 family, glioxin efflux transporter
MRVVFQTLGGAFLVSAGESIFVNKLVAGILLNAPGVDPTVVVAVGATGLRQAFTESQLPGIILSYMTALKSVYAFTIGLVGLATLIGAFSCKVVMGAAK